jgi:hypothetical protein
VRWLGGLRPRLLLERDHVHSYQIAPSNFLLFCPRGRGSRRVCCIVEMTDWFALLSDDLLLLVLERVATAKDLGCARGVNVTFRRQSDSESLWAHWCESEGITRAGSSRPTSRTYCSWLQTWREARCAECGDTYVAKINLDGGSSQATMWHGLKVPLCGAHACGEYQARTPPS